jgi:hypothetical protein
MKRKILVSIAAFVTLAIMMSVAKAQITASIQVNGSYGNKLNQETVPINSAVHVSGHYEDLISNQVAQGVMDVYFNDGTGLKYKATIWSGTIEDGETVTSTAYTLTQMGTYEFRWTVKLGDATQCTERAQARTVIQLVTPEPGTIAGLAMALSAFGFMALKKIRTK